MLLSLSLSNMPKYICMYLYELDSEYASGPKYAKILNMAGSQYGELLSMPKHALTKF